ncbi:zinc finger CCCH domain-containing protein 14 [Aplysia californica]|uniref:Zinc finger CCCH domain-containing protein 14 n=1 Tax=Aplysia californica TaxID=6500 RepID=A0ABM0JU94_APLCA|nr:zinc finger CCCH domain-containing protein 14 [Aplysia californica]
MEVGVEISQKIRSAIKAKLMELGCYVDDELPDYIMVMVANKKTRAQMSGDLSLFLGTNTDTFTEWLHGLLVKLQAINTESSNQQSTDKNEKSKSSKKKEKSKKSDSSRKDKDKKSKKSDSKNIDLDPSSKNSVLNTEKERSVKSVTDDGENAHSDTVHVSNSGSKEPAPSESSKVSEDVEDVRQLLVTETTSDALAEELETTETEVVAKESREVKVTNSTKVKSNVAALSLKSGRRLSRSKSHSPERPAVSARKRKTPISVVSSVSRPGNDDEEEYDPHNPSVGSVASVVKVTNRKSSVPPALQANRALLMKAMTEAERSIAVKRKVAVTRPMSRSDSPAETYSPKRRCSNQADREETPPPYIPSKKEVPSQLRGGSTQESVRSSLARNDARHLLNKEERRELISRSRRQELLQSIGIQQEEKKTVHSSSRPLERKNEKDVVAGKVVHQREVRDERKSGGIKNFQITTRLVSAPGSNVVRSRHSQTPPSRDKPAVSRTTVAPPARSSVTSRLGKVVSERRSSSAGSDSVDLRTKQLSSRTGKVSAEVKDGRNGGSRTGLSLLGKEVVRKQCEAAVMSVKAAQTAKVRARSPDSRVVCCDPEIIALKEEVTEEIGDLEGSVELMEGKFEESSDKAKDASSSVDDDAEDLAEMISNDFEPEILEDSQNDEFTLDLDDDDIIKVVGGIDEEGGEDLKGALKQEEFKKGTRFIVTLDGIDEREFDEQQDSFDKFKLPILGSSGPRMSAEVVGQRENVVLDALASQVGPGMHPVLLQARLPPQTLHPQHALQDFPQSTTAKITPPKIQPFSISLKDSDDEHENKMEAKSYSDLSESVSEGVSAVKRAKLSERCRFWPACAAGGACEYWHPTTHCKTFPNCKFGDKCLFIHPNCRFDSKCTRPDCPFTHTSKRSGLTSAGGAPPHVIAIPQSHVLFSPTLSSKAYAAGFGAVPTRLPSSSLGGGHQTVCRFYPNCHNVNCSFLHPKPCRFGLSCRTPTCPFYHPSVPTKDKLKWQASQTSTLPKAQDSAILLHSGSKVVDVSPAPVKLSEGHVSVSSTSQ